jgi:hypothetical protein
LQGSVVANQTATKKDNGLYKVDMIFDTFQKGEHILVVARHGNKSYIIYNSTDDQIIKRKVFFGHIHSYPYNFVLKLMNIKFSSSIAEYIFVCESTDVQFVC